MKQISKKSLPKRGLCLNGALSLLFFAVLSPPHRVHHVFERLAPTAGAGLAALESHDHGQSRDHRHPAQPAPPANSTDCAVLSGVQSANGIAADPIDLVTPAWTVEFAVDPSLRIISSFNPSPRTQRAPPLL
jgi:hypothetical protein